MKNENLLHLGCGELVGAHWKNVDSSLNVLLDNHSILKHLFKWILPNSSKKMKFKGVQYLDLRRRWPFATSSIDAIYSSHFFEHLSLSDGQKVLSESFRCLKAGGKIRFLVPSIAIDITEYLHQKKASNPLAATEFAHRTYVFAEIPNGSWWYRVFFSLYNKNSHKMFYDSESLGQYFKQAGFVSVQAMSYLESEIRYLNEVEIQDRFNGSACVEGTKP